MRSSAEEKHGGSMATQVENTRRRYMKKRQSYPSGLLTDFDYLNAPVKPDEDVLRDQVQRYRDGDESQRNAIISAHLHVVASIAGDFGRRDSDEILGVALLELVDAVDRAPTALSDNEITPYITKSVRYRIKDAIGENRPVYMPSRTFRYKAAHGEIDREGSDDPTIRGVLSLTAVVKEDDPLGDEPDMDDSGARWQGAYTVPTARAERPCIEFREILALSIRDKTEEKIVTMAAEGHSYGEIETILQMKKSHIGYLLTRVMDRFDRLYA